MGEQTGTLKVGTVGTSSIMEVIQDAMSRVPELTCRTVYSRNEETGRRFAEKMGVQEVCTDFAEFTAKPELDVIYIASPNVFHAEQAEAALKAGKHVIVEKPMAVTRAESEHLVETARANEVMILEAISTLFMPNYLKAKELLPKLGKIEKAVIRFGNYSSKYEAYLRGENPNIFNPKMQAGALNDMGIYCIHAAIDLFGAPQSAVYEPELGPNGIDIAGALHLTYPGFECLIETAKDKNLDNGIRIVGEKGSIEATGALNSVPELHAVIDGQEYGSVPDQAENRLVYEQERFAKALLEKDGAFFERMAKQSIEASAVLEAAH